MPISIKFEPIRQHLTENTLIVTPNARTQKALIAGFIQSVSAGSVVEGPKVVSMSQWINDLWQSVSFLKVLPKEVNDLALKNWLKEQIAADPHWQLTNSLGVAEKLLEAYRNLRLWNKHIHDLKSLDTPEQQYFVLWISKLEDFLKKNKLITSFNKTHFLIEQCSSQLKTMLPKHVVLFGFNQLTPLDIYWIKFLESHHAKVQHLKPDEKASKISKIAAVDFKQELAIAAAYAKKQSQKSESASIGIVVHQLSENLGFVQQVFREYFDPEFSLPWRDLVKTKYNISAGQVLADIPQINAAIKILKFDQRGFDLQSLNFLKNSPFIGWGKNAEAIKYFLYQQCLLSYEFYSIDYLLSAISQQRSSLQLTALSERLQLLKAMDKNAKPIKKWCDEWRRQLYLWQWYAKEQTDDARLKLETVLTDSFQQALSINDFFARLSASKALEYLNQLLRQSVYQLPSDRTNIQVLGLLEASGLEFDELIIVGFNRDNWPQKHKLNPFISTHFQQRYQMPGSSASREYDYASDLSRSLLTCADKVLITHSSIDSDSDSSESALFSHFAEAEINLEQLLDNNFKLVTDYQWVSDQLIDIRINDIKGGAYLLSQYASCPFKAMVNFQFQLKAQQIPLKGIQPQIRGAWLHRALEILWTEIGDQKSLLELDELQLQEEINAAILNAQEDFQSQLSSTASNQLINLEVDKMAIKILQWMVIEKSRKPFKATTEVIKQLDLGSLTFSFRIDRIDINEQGGLEIIDYKTGAVDVKKWLGERPEEAQMPAYVLACQNQMVSKKQAGFSSQNKLTNLEEKNKVASIGYAKIKTGEVLWSGFCFDSGGEKGVQFLETGEEGTKDKTRYLLASQNDKTNIALHNSTALIEQWRVNLENIAQKIIAGEMPVSPKNINQTCLYCDYQSFCRIAEEQPQNELQSRPISSQSEACDNLMRDKNQCNK